MCPVPCVKPLSSLTTKFGCIEADPPWYELGGGKIIRGAQRHYPLMKTPEICALPVASICAPDVHLYLWVTNNALAKGWGHDVARAWGFTPITILSWLKDGNPGLGQYFRGNSEHVLFCRRGMPEYKTHPITDKRAQGLTAFVYGSVEEEGAWWNEVRPDERTHSRKPMKIKEWAELVSHGPYLEMFARTRRPGWEAWGNEAPELAP